MRRRFFAVFSFIGVTLVVVAIAPVSAQTTAALRGHWVNPRGSVVVEMKACGQHLCGQVSWASAEALQDAKDAGIASLVGTELLQDYNPSASGVWHGRVYVPDMGRTFYSTINVDSPGALRISGCILGGLICKSQVWRRQD